MTDIVKIGDATLYHGDCLEILPTLDKVDAVVTDPPYHGVKRDDWDNQWESDTEFIEWTQSIASTLKNIITDNGSLYWFCSPQMSARVEIAIRTQFNVLGNLVWNRGGSRKGSAGSGIDVTALRSFWTASTERIIFAEMYSQNHYESQCIALKRTIFGDYIKSEIDRFGASSKEIMALFPSKTGGLTGCVSNWVNGANVPTSQQYGVIRDYLNKDGGSYLSKEYEQLRKEYEQLRRPFNIDAEDQWGDIWGFSIERGQVHPTQKPIRLIEQIIKISTSTATIALDPFMGSGTTGVACANLGRKFIGIEIERKYFDIACERIEAAYAQGRLFD